MRHILASLAAAFLVSGCSPKGEEFILCDAGGKSYIEAAILPPGTKKIVTVLPRPNTRVRKVKSEKYGTMQLDKVEILDGDLKGKVVLIEEGHLCPVED